MRSYKEHIRIAGETEVNNDNKPKRWMQEIIVRPDNSYIGLFTYTLGRPKEVGIPYVIVGKIKENIIEGYVIGSANHTSYRFELQEAMKKPGVNDNASSICVAQTLTGKWIESGDIFSKPTVTRSSIGKYTSISYKEGGKKVRQKVEEMLKASTNAEKTFKMATKSLEKPNGIEKWHGIGAQVKRLIAGTKRGR